MRDTKYAVTSLGERPHFDPDSWDRAGMGRSYSIGASREELVDEVLRSLPDQFAPYSFVADRGDFIGKFRHLIGSKQYAEFPASEILQRMDEGMFRFRIRSLPLTPILDWSPSKILAALHVNGLVVIQDGTDIRPHAWASDVSILHRIFNNVSMEEYTHTEYNLIYSAIVKSLSGKQRIHCLGTDKYKIIFDSKNTRRNIALVPIEE
jgi:hypothetical protein